MLTEYDMKQIMAIKQRYYESLVDTEDGYNDDEELFELLSAEQFEAEEAENIIE